LVFGRIAVSGAPSVLPLPGLLERVHGHCQPVNRYIERLVDAGFEDRVMFGTDQMEWPKLMAYSISIVQNADYLTPEQKRDILYNNAARFYRLATSVQH
jgi:predicted TIM-barrel fold metal-dependent hydrolase